MINVETVLICAVNASLFLETFLFSTSYLSHYVPFILSPENSLSPSASVGQHPCPEPASSVAVRY